MFLNKYNLTMWNKFCGATNTLIAQLTVSPCMCFYIFKSEVKVALKVKWQMETDQH